MIKTLGSEDKIWDFLREPLIYYRLDYRRWKFATVEWSSSMDSNTLKLRQKCLKFSCCVYKVLLQRSPITSMSSVYRILCRELFFVTMHFLILFIRFSIILITAVVAFLHSKASGRQNFSSVAHSPPADCAHAHKPPWLLSSLECLITLWANKRSLNILFCGTTSVVLFPLGQNF